MGLQFHKIIQCKLPKCLHVVMSAPKCPRLILHFPEVKFNIVLVSLLHLLMYSIIEFNSNIFASNYYVIKVNVNIVNIFKKLCLPLNFYYQKSVIHISMFSLSKLISRNPSFVSRTMDMRK